MPDDASSPESVPDKSRLHYSWARLHSPCSSDGTGSTMQRSVPRPTVAPATQILWNLQRWGECSRPTWRSGSWSRCCSCTAARPMLLSVYHAASGCLQSWVFSGRLVRWVSSTSGPFRWRVCSVGLGGRQVIPHAQFGQHRLPRQMPIPAQRRIGTTAIAHLARLMRDFPGLVREPIPAPGGPARTCGGRSFARPNLVPRSPTYHGCVANSGQSSTVGGGDARAVLPAGSVHRSGGRSASPPPVPDGTSRRSAPQRYPFRADRKSVV
jgi:hypothetical protein